MSAMSCVETAATWTTKEVAGCGLPVAGWGVGGLSPAMMVSEGAMALDAATGTATAVGAGAGVAATGSATWALDFDGTARLPAVGFAAAARVLEVGFEAVALMDEPWADLRPRE